MFVFSVQGARLDMTALKMAMHCAWERGGGRGAGKIIALRAGPEVIEGLLDAVESRMARTFDRRITTTYRVGTPWGQVELVPSMGESSEAELVDHEGNVVVRVVAIGG